MAPGLSVLLPSVEREVMVYVGSENWPAVRVYVCTGKRGTVRDSECARLAWWREGSRAEKWSEGRSRSASGNAKDDQWKGTWDPGQI